MSKKSFNASGVKSAIAGNNNLEITFVDAVGRKQVVNLSPDARKHMMTALLTKPAHLKPEEPDPFENERFLNVIGFQTATVANGQPALMLHLGGNLSLGITVPEAGKKAIQEIAATYGDLSHIDLEKIDTESRH